jgi:hypothetical protein
MILLSGQVAAILAEKNELLSVGVIDEEKHSSMLSSCAQWRVCCSSIVNMIDNQISVETNDFISFFI